MDEMQGAEDEGEGSVLEYVTEHEFRKQRSRSPFCNFHWGGGLLKGGGEELDVADHAEETIGACRGEVLFEAYLVDEVEVGMENVGRGLSAKYF